LDLEQILENCKASLLSTACPDGIARLPFCASTEEASKARTIYLEAQHHSSLSALWKSNEREGGGEKESKAWIVYTFEPFVQELEGKFDATMRKSDELFSQAIEGNFDSAKNRRGVIVEKLSSFKSEAALVRLLEDFWQKEEQEGEKEGIDMGGRGEAASSAAFLVLQCDVVNDCQHLLSVKTLISRYRANYLKSLDESSKPKSVCLLLHTRRERELTKLLGTSFCSTFLCGWEQVTVDTIFPTSLSLGTIVGKTSSGSYSIPN